MIQWLVTNWVAVLAVVIAVDQVLIPIFPKIPFLVTLKDTLSKIKPPAA